MFIILKDNKVVSTSSIKPCEEDLKNRNEIWLEKDASPIVSIGDVYSDGKLLPSKEPIKEPEEVPLEELSNESLLHLIRAMYQDSYYY
jgi:hypothetical protein